MEIRNHFFFNKIKWPVDKWLDSSLSDAYEKSKFPSLEFMDWVCVAFPFSEL